MAESFFQRWTRRKAEAAGTTDEPGMQSPPQHVGNSAPEADGERSASTSSARPTLGDIALLNAESDYSAFVATGVDKAVHRAAMKKLFSAPHFNIMDGLDIYIDDYNKPSPVSAAMLAALQHSKSTLDPQPYRAGQKDDEDEGEGQQERDEPVDAATALDLPENETGDEPEEPTHNESPRGELPDPS
ncbi:MAG TPA: DUF3306 domain-containing protein [Noviherbaspirillum sp.]|jgi:hypothetical protein|uniref:DUF3306 domain-containing protein n=1 Tax=Noviherbaspirillum sp. TaxID=1926288 RepID=UPI002DDD2E7F|nr:DUF3306 domain-containing protein [Noviherbaspirillum sp.]HEV2609256.1 DUF3306 domain-containing protein [Noviherbaspirillum sp.]